MIDLNLHYNGNISDGSESINEGILTNPIDLFLQEIELAVKIGPNEIWGKMRSIELTKYLFNKYITVLRIKNEISNFISINCEHARIFSWDIDVKLILVDKKELLHIEFNIFDAPNNRNIVEKYLLGE